MSDPSSDLLNLRRSVRYFVSNAEAIQAHIEFDADGVRRQERCELLDISTQGLKLHASCCLTIHQPVQIRVRIEVCRMELELSGTVCWCRPRENDHCWIGVLLETEIAHSQLDQIAVQGVIDRRRDRRLTIGADALIRFELAATSFSATILDLSPRGFSVITSGSAAVGDRILLLVPQASDDGLPIPARICWLRAEKEDFIYGCEFFSGNAASDVRARLTLRESQEEALRSRLRTARRERALPLLIPAACVAMLLCWQFGNPSGGTSDASMHMAPAVYLDHVADVPILSAVSPRSPLLRSAISALPKADSPSTHALIPYIDWFFDHWGALRAEARGK